MGLAKACRDMTFTVVVLIKNVTAVCLEQPYLGLYRCVLILKAPVGCQNPCVVLGDERRKCRCH